MARKATRASWGHIRKLPSGRLQASYIGPDSMRYNAPSTFDTLTDARGWLATARADMIAGRWQPASVRAAEQADRAQTLGAYSGTWLESRTNAAGDHLRPRTVDEYRRLLAGPLSQLTPISIGQITPATVRQWRADQLAGGRKTQTSRAYGLLAAILSTAIVDRLTERNPCVVRGGGSTSTGRQVVPPTDAELETILGAITPRFRALVSIAAMGGLRYGEAVALRARDVTVERSETGAVVAVRVTVSRAVGRTAEGIVPGPTKSAAGVRRHAIFGVDAVIIAEHVNGLIADRLLFPAADGVSFLSTSSFWWHWNRARAVAGLPDLSFHSLRHFHGTRYAQAGATLKETMVRQGQSSASAAMRYLHTTGRDDELAARMSRTS